MFSVNTKYIFGYKWLARALCQRFMSSTATNTSITSDDYLSKPSMSCWQLNAYSKTLTETTLTLNTSRDKPVVQKASELMVKVLASSVNPIDLAMTSGYGRSLLDALQLTTDFGVDAISYDRLPLILGRDFCGQVIQCGHGVSQYRVGDIVWGALPPFWRCGSHSQFIVADESHLCLKPSNLSAIESAAIPYVGLTAWAAIHTIGGLNEQNSVNKRALVLGGSGGVGTFAIQLLKAWGAHVTTTCAADAFDFVYDNTGADYCIDYNTNELNQSSESFDFVLNAASFGQNRDQRPEFGANESYKWKAAQYVTLSTPLLDNTDRYGVIVGTGLSALTAIKQTIDDCVDGHNTRWAFYWANPCALKAITHLVQTNQIKPIIEKTINFNQLPIAFDKLSKGHARGKTVIDFT